MKILDLCAGTGSATKAFQDRGHDVDTLDIVGGHTFNTDVRKFKPWKKYDFVWASPECKQFSLANYRLGACKDRRPDLSVVEACLRICKTAPYWILENPSPGCLEYFIGRPQMCLNLGDYGHWCKKPTGFWGTFPFFYSQSKRKSLISHSRGVWSSSPERASIPYGLSLSICRALEREMV